MLLPQWQTKTPTLGSARSMTGSAASGWGQDRWSRWTRAAAAPALASATLSGMSLGPLAQPARETPGLGQPHHVGLDGLGALSSRVLKADGQAAPVGRDGRRFAADELGPL